MITAQIHDHAARRRSYEIVAAVRDGLASRAPRLALESKSAKQLPMQPLFNPLSPEFIGDPYPFYHRLRTAAPFYRAPSAFWR